MSETITPIGWINPASLTISPRQIRQALTAFGIRSAVEAAVASGDQNLRDWWEFATQFERGHPLVSAMANQLGITSDQLDQLWILGSSL